MPAPRDQELLVRTARMYYQENRSQGEIATALGLSRSNVSRMLTSARERGIVEIRINDPTGRDLTLERELAEVFGLRDARVADVAPPDRALSRVGDLGARWLMENLADGARVAVSWGTTMQALVAAVPVDAGETQDLGDIEVVPLVGGLSSVEASITGEELVRDLAGRLGGRMRRLHAPAILTSAETRDVLLAEPSISEILATAREADIALVGIGRAGIGSSAAIVEAVHLDAAERKAFDRAAPVGDMCARYYDADGHAVPGPLDDRVIAVTLADLARIPTVLGVASGRDKLPGVLGALRTGTVDVLVCDRALARALLAGAAVKRS
jgi:DNA-binding transcriptional regulator LsrR (DeoR family)